MYTLSKPVTLNESSEKQVEFIPKVYNVPIRKFNQILINAGGYSQNNIQASSKIRFNNTKSAGMGMPLPKGTVRVFKEDTADKSLEFIGEDSIQHTPKDENVTLTIGNAFDVKADRDALFDPMRNTLESAACALFYDRERDLVLAIVAALLVETPFGYARASYGGADPDDERRDALRALRIVGRVSRELRATMGDAS